MTLALAIRRPTAREVAWVDRQWSKDVMLRSVYRSGRPKTWAPDSGWWSSPNPDHAMTPTVYRQAMRLFVRETLRDANILVADLEAVPDEPVGWIAYQDETVFYVRVLGDARRRGVASALVEASGAKVPAYLTPEGGALFGINYRPGAVTEDGGADARQSHARAVAVVES